MIWCVRVLVVVVAAATVAAAAAGFALGTCMDFFFHFLIFRLVSKAMWYGSRGFMRCQRSSKFGYNISDGALCMYVCLYVYVRCVFVCVWTKWPPSPIFFFKRLFFSFLLSIILFTLAHSLLSHLPSIHTLYIYMCLRWIFLRVYRTCQIWCWFHTEHTT